MSTYESFHLEVEKYQGFSVMLAIPANFGIDV